MSTETAVLLPFEIPIGKDQEIDFTDAEDLGIGYLLLEQSQCGPFLTSATVLQIRLAEPTGDGIKVEFLGQKPKNYEEIEAISFVRAAALSDKRVCLIDGSEKHFFLIS